MGIVHELNCKLCGRLTIHAEDTVPDIESATVWHCLICGTERRPNEPGTPNEKAILPYSPLSPSDGAKIKVRV